MTVRLSKALLVLMAGLLVLMAGIDNILDYGTNFTAVQHVLAMDTVFPSTTSAWRAISSPVLQHAAYAVIIVIELLTGVLCILGAHRLWTVRAAPAQAFNAAKELAVAGLVCGIGLYLFGFLTIAAEWFEMWQSKDWNAQASAFRFMACLAFVLIFLNQRDDDIT